MKLKRDYLGHDEWGVDEVKICTEIRKLDQREK